MLCSPNAAGLGCVDKDIVLLQLLDVALDLVHLFGETIHAVLLAHGVEGHLVVGLLLELLVECLPLLLKGGDQLLAFAVWHQELLTVTLILLFDLHLTH